MKTVQQNKELLNGNHNGITFSEALIEKLTGEENNPFFEYEGNGKDGKIYKAYLTFNKNNFEISFNLTAPSDKTYIIDDPCSYFEISACADKSDILYILDWYLEDFIELAKCFDKDGEYIDNSSEEYDNLCRDINYLMEQETYSYSHCEASEWYQDCGEDFKKQIKESLGSGKNEDDIINALVEEWKVNELMLLTGVEDYFLGLLEEVKAGA